MPPPDGCQHNSNEDDVNSSTSPVNFLDQNYQELHQKCLAENTLYNDELFPPDSSSLGLFEDETAQLIMTQVVWKRPSELVSDPNLVVDGLSRFDYAQGYLGNCWFLAAVGALTFADDIKNQVMPAEQSFATDYAGIFHFRFWRFGKWIDVVIDDQLPTFSDKLIFVSSKTTNEFWPALLEKAYAKVCGSYADLRGGLVTEGLMDFTGGTHMFYMLNTAPADLWEIMARAFMSKTLMGCASIALTAPEENELLRGIIDSHAYTVTGVIEVTSDENPVHLVRLLNPWGKEEWRGDWRDGSPLWDTVCEDVRNICHEVLDDGEFWMSMEDFTTIFQCLDICCRCPDFLDGSSECHWTSKRHFGRWTAGTTAGGDIIKTGHMEYKVYLNDEAPVPAATKRRWTQNNTIENISSDDSGDNGSKSNRNSTDAHGNFSLDDENEAVSDADGNFSDADESFPADEEGNVFSTVYANFPETHIVRNHSAVCEGSTEERDGCAKTFWTNPQFRLTIEELNEECESGQRPENTLVSLMQNHEVKNRNSLINYDIGFYVFEIPLEMRSQSGRFSSEFFVDREPVAQTDYLFGLREVMKFFRLEPGEYLIVPCTENPGEAASFILTISSKNETHFENIQEASE